MIEFDSMRLELEAMIHLVKCGMSSLDVNKIYKYAEKYTDTLISIDGKLQGYKMSDFKLDDINNGKLLYLLYDKTGKQQYKNIIDTLFKQLELQPRVAEGGYWHKNIYTQQMWLDGLYMAEPFKAEYLKRYCKNNKEKLNAGVADIINQFTLIYKHTLCPTCHLPHHGWDAIHKQSWCDPETGRSAHSWGRATGWYMMAIVDTYEILKNTKGTEVNIKPLKYIINEISSKLIKLQDKQNGCWQQVLDMTGNQGNYFEMSASSMIAYSFAKGYKLGLLNETYKKSADKALKGICNNYIKIDKNTGLVTLTNICSVAGLSNDRDGSFEYYIKEPIRDNDPKGVGPFIFSLVTSCQK